MENTHESMTREEVHALLRQMIPGYAFTDQGSGFKREKPRKQLLGDVEGRYRRIAQANGISLKGIISVTQLREEYPHIFTVETRRKSLHVLRMVQES